MRKLQLDFLKEEKIGVSKNVGEYWVEAAIICFLNNGHQSGVNILVNVEEQQHSFQLAWTDKITEKVIRSWGDFVEAAEYGATAIAALLISPLTGLVVSGRVPQLMQADYTLQTVENYENGEIEPDALLEVSGIFRKNKGNTVNMRVQKKRKHIENNSKRDYLTYVIIVEFSAPKSKMIQI